MPDFLEVEGKSIDEAIFSGLEKMGTTIDQVKIDILEDSSRGFLGIGQKRARVRLTLKTEEEAKAAVAQEEEPEKHTSPARPVFGRQEAGRPPRRADSFRREERVTEDFVPQDDPSFVEGNTAAEIFLRELLETMGRKGTVRSKETEEALLLAVTGTQGGALIGHRGETMDALQHLVSLIANKDRGDYTRVLLDVENYRQKREHTLQQLAHRCAANVARSGRRFVLEPMNPYERRIIHSALQADKRVTTLSEGTEPYRRVVVSPAEK